MCSFCGALIRVPVAKQYSGGEHGGKKRLRVRDLPCPSCRKVGGIKRIGRTRYDAIRRRREISVTVYEPKRPD